MKDIQPQKSQLNKVESEWKLEEATMLAEMQRKWAERQLKLEEERIKLGQLQAEKEVQVAAAQVRAYDSAESDC